MKIISVSHSCGNTGIDRETFIIVHYLPCKYNISSRYGGRGICVFNFNSRFFNTVMKVNVGSWYSRGGNWGDY